MKRWLRGTVKDSYDAALLGMAVLSLLAAVTIVALNAVGLVP